MPVPFTIKENAIYTPCPRCGNNTHFTGFSEQSGVDCCDVWIECKCGYDPTAEHTTYRYEDVWGGVNIETMTMALECWNDVIAEFVNNEDTPTPHTP